MSLVFNHPIFFLLYIPMLAGIYYTHFWPSRGGRISLPISIWGGDRFHSYQGIYSFLAFFSNLFYWVAIAVIIFAMTEPEKIGKEKIFLKKGKDIIVILDESPSMFARDMGDSRFEVAKKQLSNFVSLRENDAIGLITFSSDAVLRVPPTQDYPILQRQIAELKARDNQLGDSTDIGMALAFALYHLSHCSGTGQFIVLISDGINNSTVLDPLEVARIAKSRGIRIFPIGIGSLYETTSLSMQELSGKIVQGEIEARRNDKLLNQLASITGGQFDSSSTVSVLQEIFQNINSFEPSNTESRVDRTQVSYVRNSIFFALFCFALYFIFRKIWMQEIL